jgi:hypothetical protein
MWGGEFVRTLQTRELAGVFIPERGNTNPVMIGGDFNDLPESETILEMTDTGALGMFADQNPGVEGCTSFGGDFDITDPAEEAVKRIGYPFMMDAGGTATASELFLDSARDIDPGPGESWRWASDHIEVTATFPSNGH